MDFHILTSIYLSFIAPQSPFSARLFHLHPRCMSAGASVSLNEHIKRSHPWELFASFSLMSMWTSVISRLKTVPLLHHTEFHLYICNTLCFRRVRTRGLINVLRVLSEVLPYGVWYYPLIFLFFCSGSLTCGRKFLFCCNNLNSTSEGRFAGVSVDIFSGAFNLTIGIFSVLLEWNYFTISVTMPCVV